MSSNAKRPENDLDEGYVSNRITMWIAMKMQRSGA